MPKARLHDDGDSIPTASLSVRQAIEGDRCDIPVQPYPDMDSNLPVLTVRQPTRNGFDDDGNPKWTWTTVLSGPAAYFEELTLLGASGAATGPARRLGRLGRFPVDPEAGKSVIYAQATMHFPGDYEGDEITESAKVYHENGRRYSVTRVITHPDAIDLVLTRPSQGG